MKKIVFFIMLLCSYYSFSQVGIGTTTPSSELEIETTNTGIPALRLNPQSAPTGSMTGQLAVIGDQLFMYDATRAKWLSTGAVAIQFGTNGNSDGQNLSYGGTMRNSGSGPLMPFNGTIVGITGNCSGGNSNKGFELRVFDWTGFGTNTTISYNFNLSNYEFNNSTLNLDFNINDYISLSSSSSGSSVANPAIVVWVKWRE
ncbi:hypothetical protein [Flavivirga sp. 57AJ16]|uniref:hypothetical protein n=1 Tax=Flavivirga sp. 57AJ16 TaxID=3025307 RepID=UPI00236590EC|nr:hypothetical protein [Flavivirga sp. 57AJ16]MDD7886490.1 hypothetical protein [Flavivirga sp. 57AJ16]